MEDTEEEEVKVEKDKDCVSKEQREGGGQRQSQDDAKGKGHCKQSDSFVSVNRTCYISYEQAKERHKGKAQVVLWR